MSQMIYSHNASIPKRVKMKVVAKPVISQSKLPPEFILQKRLQKVKSEEKFALNDLIDYSNYKNKGQMQGQKEPLSKFVQYKNRLVDYVNSNFLDENEPDLYQSLVIQKNQADYVRQIEQVQSKFETSKKLMEQQQRETFNSSRSSALFDMQQIKIISTQDKSEDEMRETFYQTKEQMKKKRVPYTQRDASPADDHTFDNVYEKEDVELQITNIHFKMKKDHKERIKSFLKVHNDQLSQIQTLKQNYQQEEQQKLNKHNNDSFLNYVRSNQCQEVYEAVLNKPELIYSQDKDLNNGLHIAVINQNYDMVELLIFLGADIYAKNNRRKDPEELANEEENNQILNLIKMKKNKITIKYNMWKFREYDRITKLRQKIINHKVKSEERLKTLNTYMQQQKRL